MCYLARQHQAPIEDSEAAQPTHSPQFRPRWVAAAAVAAAAGLAVAAFLAPVPPASADEASGGPQTVVQTVPVAPALEQVSTSADDGVPSTTDLAAAAGRSCEGGL